MREIAILILAFVSSVAQADAYVQDSADIARHIMKEQLKEKDDLKAGNQNTINQGANTGQASQNAGSAANAAAGAALIASGMALLPNPPTAAQGAALIALGMLALAQAGHDSGAAAASGRTAAASVLQNEGKPGDVQKPEAGEADFYNQMKKAGEALKANGYSFNDKGLTGPDGKTIPKSAFNSTSAMAAAGVDPKAIAELNKVNDAIADELAKYRVSSVATNNAGAGGGMNEGGGAGVTGEEETGAAINPFDLNADKQKQLVAGKTINLDGDPIGVAGANIFEMVHDAYQKKRSGNQFIEAEGSPPTRQPASRPK